MIFKVLHHNTFQFSQIAYQPHNLPAVLLCDENRVNLRCVVNETVIRIVYNFWDNKKSEIAARFDDPRKRRTMEMYFENEFGTHIENHVYLGFHLYSLFLHSRFSDDAGFVLLLPKTWWTTAVKEELDDLPIEIHIAGRDHNRLLLVGLLQKIFSKIRSKLTSRGGIKSPLNERMVFRTLPDNCPPPFSNKGKKPNGINISTIICDGVVPNRRNNLRWLWTKHVKSDRLVLVIWDYFAKTFSLDELNIIKQAGIRIWRSQRGASQMNSEIRVWRRSKNYIRFFHDMMKPLFALLPKTLKPKASRLRWQLFRYLIIIASTAWWSDFFKTNNIKIFLEELHERSVFARALAICNVNGILCLMERSQDYDNHHIWSSRPADIAFIAGTHSLRQMVLKDKQSPSIVITGYITDKVANDGTSSKEDLSFLFGEPSEKPVILIIDEPGVIYGPEHVIEFYEKLFTDITASDSYRIMIKTKKRELIPSLLSDSYKQLVSLIDKGSAIVIDPELTITHVAGFADLVISLPSTAMLDSIALGKRTVIYNPYRTIRRIFYEQGLFNKCIYEDMDKLIEDLHDFLNGQKVDFGECQKVRNILDPFRDGEAAERIGYFLEELSCALEETKDCNVALSLALEKYSQTAGDHYAGNWSQLWPRFHRYNSEVQLNLNVK